jgi:hypothetical protein
VKGVSAFVLLILCSVLECAGSAAAAAPVPKWTAWKNDATAPETRHVAGLTFTMQVRRTEDSATPVLRITAPGKGPFKIEGAEGLATYVYASFVVLPADLPAHGQAILFRSYTGGAHCCQAYKLIEPKRGGWAVHDAGQWDGSGPEPADVDHDGHIELVAGDMRFDYRLTDHAESLLPPVILAIRNGALVDISTEPRFIPFFGSKLAEGRTACENRGTSIGACLGYVAIAARAGRAAEALKLLDAGPSVTPSPIHIAGQEGLPYLVPEHCGSTVSGGAFSCDHEEPRRSFTDRHAAVVWFLTDLGYLPGAQPPGKQP